MLSTAESGSEAPEGQHGGIARTEAWVLATALAVLVSLNLPSLGADPWPFRTGPLAPHGILAPLVRAAHRHWDVGAMRSAAAVAGLVVVALVGLLISRGRVRRSVAVAATAITLCLLILPSVLLQAGLREASAPWFHDNDSTYQIELAGQLVRSGDNPYGYDYSRTGLARFYSLDGSLPQAGARPQPALEHFAYFPGGALAAAVWGVLPSPFDDYRFLVALATLGLCGAALLFPGPLGLRLAVGAALAGNPLAVRAVWFGTADAPSLLCLVLAFCFVRRSRYAAAGAALAAAILFKQFALVAVPFLAAALVMRASREQLIRAGAAFTAVLAAGILPFLIADPGAMWSDTISYGTGTYRIIGYGLASLLLRADIVSSSTGYYPFTWLALVVWVPITVALLRAQWRDRTLAFAATGFAISMYTLLFISRVFQTSYMLWPLTAIGVAVLLSTGVAARSARDGSRPPASPSPAFSPDA